MTEREAMKLALEALDTLPAGTSYKTHNAASALRQALEQPEQEPVAWQLLVGADTPLDAPMGWQQYNIYDSLQQAEVSARTINSYKQAPFAKVVPLYAAPQKKTHRTTGNLLKDAYVAMVNKKHQALEQPECNPHPDAPHGFNRESSHSLGRYVCDCEGWEPEEQEPVTWRNAAIRLGEDLYSVGPNGYYNMTASQWLDWALSVVNTAPPKPAQDLIVGYADSHDIARAGHDFWVSRQPGKNTVPLYLYGHPPKIWQGLTDEEEIELDEKYGDDFNAYIAARDAKLKEKNRE